MSAVIRAAVADDAEALQAVEAHADALLIDRIGATHWPAAADGASRLAAPGFVLVLEDSDSSSPDDSSPVGFVHVLDAEGHAHLEQLSVLPSAGRRGHGRRLVEAALAEARERGYTRVSLRTYAEIPWNAPFYASCGFLESIPETSFQRALVDTEARLDLDRYGRRIQMTVEL
ncbi:GNAT family N-acetyltransferase [Microbacterium foliorum]|uniref:Acetyltransferase (GNAT) family protein n=1 Tax=Microbacterium foliorum TaxID=104336 RepID=A0A0F0KTX1_9MICO|nr:GNAT family N-acetyltransferase [Microbacterium foliorum]AXL12510.1 GNAT family N-acetyltransferase [Microbacterium foliorum]KJL22671.1 Acetyltransferase (GNAT) family protein [Microbacterium foliorum]